MINGVMKRHRFYRMIFDECYFQSVPDDQQIDFPVGNEVITLTNIHPTRPEIHFKLPRLNNVPVRLYQRDGEVVLLTPKVDTPILNPKIISLLFGVVIIRSVLFKMLNKCL